MIKQNDPRRWQERADARMIQEDHNAIANLSPEFINKQIYHNQPVYGPGSRPYGQDQEETVLMFFNAVKGKK